jgi:hypothetical protein
MTVQDLTQSAYELTIFQGSHPFEVRRWMPTGRVHLVGVYATEADALAAIVRCKQLDASDNGRHLAI